DLSTIVDVNQDGQIDNADLQALIGVVADQAMNSGTGSVTTVPEPSALILLCIAAVALPFFKSSACRTGAGRPSGGARYLHQLQQRPAERYQYHRPGRRCT